MREKREQEEKKIDPSDSSSIHQILFLLDPHLNQAEKRRKEKEGERDVGERLRYVIARSANVSSFVNSIFRMSA